MIWVGDWWWTVLELLSWVHVLYGCMDLRYRVWRGGYVDRSLGAVDSSATVCRVVLSLKHSEDLRRESFGCEDNKKEGESLILLQREVTSRLGGITNQS